MRRAVCPGSFDPVTNGHLDIVRRASALFDEVVVAVGVNKSKHRLFAAEERIAMLEQATAPYDNVTVDGFTGLLTTFCQERGARRDRQGAAGGERLRLRAADGPDERLAHRHRDRLRAHQPGVVLPRLEPGQGGRGVRRRRVRAGPRLRARAAHRASSPRAALPARSSQRIWSRPSAPRTIPPWICLPGYRKWTAERTGPESAARARHSRARTPPGVPA